MKNTIESLKELRQRRVPAIAWLTLAVALLSSALTWGIVFSGVQEAARRDFMRLADDVAIAVTQRMLAYEQVLHGGVGMFHASTSVTRSEWKTYVEALHIEDNYPGIQGIGYAVWLSPEDLVRHEQTLRAEGFPQYRVKPAGERPEYTAIVYLEPFDARNRRAFGYDMFSEPTRHRAMVRARDTGMATLSGRVILKQETSQDIQSGFLLYLPLYKKGMPLDTVAQRRAALQGYVYSPFRANDLMQGILGTGPTNLVMQIYDGEAPVRDKLMFDSHTPEAVGSPAKRPRFETFRTLEVQGRPWTLKIDSTPIFDASIDSAKPIIVAVTGVIISLLFFAFVWSLSTLRQRALALADRMTLRLRERETFISAIVDNAADGIITVDQDGRILSFNQAAEGIFGYHCHEVVGQHADMLTVDPAQLTVASCDERTGGNRYVGKEVTGLRKNGVRFPLDLAVSAIDHRRSVFVCLVRDITDRKEAEQALRSSEERFELAIHGANDGLWDWNLDTDEVYYSPRWKAVLGFTDQELTDSIDEWHARIHPDDAQEANQRLQAHLGGETVQYQSEHRMRHKDGHYVWIYDRGIVQRNEFGRAHRMVGILSDITERKQVERLKSEFISVVSHELRTPLTSIRGSLGLLAGGALGELPQAAYELVTIAGRNSERLLALINDILDIEKMQSGSLKFRFAAVDIVPVVLQAVEANRGYAEQFGVRYVFRSEIDSATVCVDTDRLNQVMTNLLSNAAKFSAQASIVEIEVSAVRSGVRIAVRDHGAGIPEEFRPWVFEKFSQADSSDTRHKAGTGLGMHITRSLVEKMHGSIDFETETGVGTTFFITLPRHASVSTLTGKAVSAS